MNPDEKYPFLSHRTMAEVLAEEEAHSVRLAIFSIRLEIIVTFLPPKRGAWIK